MKDQDISDRFRVPQTNKALSRGCGVAAVNRALSVLGVFKPTDQGLTLSEIAERTGLYKSTILRLLESLIRYRFVERFDDDRYGIGPAPLSLGGIYQRSLRLGDVLLPLMRKLADKSHEGVSFYVRVDNTRVCLFRVESNQLVRSNVREGDVVPLPRGSAGRVLAAFTGARGETYDNIRREYLFKSVGDRAHDLVGMSAPVFGASQKLVGALAVGGPTSRSDKLFVARIRLELMKAAALATTRLGGDDRPIRLALASLDGQNTAVSARRR